MNVTVVQPPVWTDDGLANIDSIRRLVERAGIAGDLLILPELVGAELDRRRYVKAIRDLAREQTTWVVGGSHHRRQGIRIVNCGVVADPHGEIRGEYDKLGPYGAEADAGVEPGKKMCTFELDGCHVLVLVCADFWSSPILHRAPTPADLIAIPSFSVTRSPSPRPARNLWRHMAIARAYEFGAYVAISDWAATASYGGQHSSGAAGLANPHPLPGERHFLPMGRARRAAHTLDIARLHELRNDQRNRNFLTPGR